MKTRVAALAEVVAVFGLTLSLVALAGRSSLGAWTMRATNRAFIGYAVMIAAPLLLLIVSRRDLASYGITLRNPRYHLEVALTAFIPMALANVPLSLVDYGERDGALIMTAVQVALFIVIGLLLRHKPTPSGSDVLACAALMGLAAVPTARATMANALSALVFYVFFLGLGEELLFRGYIQSRLNTAFGRPFMLFGVRWGWGAVTASALFGLLHVIDLGGLIAGPWRITPWYGLWTFSGGLVLAFVREKTASVAASTLLHGLPQGIAYAFLGL